MRRFLQFAGAAFLATVVTLVTIAILNRAPFISPFTRPWVQAALR